MINFEMDKQFENCANEICELFNKAYKENVYVKPWYYSNVIFGIYNNKIFYVKYNAPGHLTVSTKYENKDVLNIVVPVLNDYMKGSPICGYIREHTVPPLLNKKVITSVVEYENLSPEPKARLIELANGLTCNKSDIIHNFHVDGNRKITDYLSNYNKEIFMKQSLGYSESNIEPDFATEPKPTQFLHGQSSAHSQIKDDGIEMAN